MVHQPVNLEVAVAYVPMWLSELLRRNLTSQITNLQLLCFLLPILNPILAWRFLLSAFSFCQFTSCSGFFLLPLDFCSMPPFGASFCLSSGLSGSLLWRAPPCCRQGQADIHLFTYWRMCAQTLHMLFSSWLCHCNGRKMFCGNYWHHPFWAIFDLGRVWH